MTDTQTDTHTYKVRSKGFSVHVPITADFKSDHQDVTEMQSLSFHV